MYYSYYFDPTYLLVLAGLALSLIAQAAVQNVTGKYAQVPARCGLTGAQLARRMLDDAGQVVRVKKKKKQD